MQPFALCCGPRDARIAIVGEAPGENEEREKRPFIGRAGQILNSILSAAGVMREECFITNVFTTRAPDNNVRKHFFLPKRAVPQSPLPSFAGSYLDPSLLPDIERLRIELQTVQPNIIIALGATALWATSGLSHISEQRGTLRYASPSLGLLPPPKLLATFHPSAIDRQWSLYPIAVLDITKAASASGPDPLFFSLKEIWIEPQFDELEQIYNYLASSPAPFAVDIETWQNQITCIGFGRLDWAASIPIFSATGSRWTHEQEFQVWKLIQKILDLPNAKILQNGLYDITYLLSTVGIIVRNPCYDVLLIHHALQPELPKSLGFMASVHLNEPSWKHIRDKKSDKDEE